MNTLKIYTSFLICAAFLVFAGCEAQERPDDDLMSDTTDTMAMQMEEPAGDTLRADLSGTAAVPGPGDEDGTGTAEVVLNDTEGTVCFDLMVEGIGEPTAAHIHSGAADASGPPVVNFDIANVGQSGCVQADAAIMDSIRTSPSNYYVNVHTQEFGAGAIRGQLGTMAEGAPGGVR